MAITHELLDGLEHINARFNELFTAQQRCSRSIGVDTKTIEQFDKRWAASELSIRALMQRLRARAETTG